jgi:polar amino acid transport system substrate-binding protein
LRGIEIDFARKLASALARPPEFVVLPWEQQIPALLQHKIDIIMSGMTITAERRQQIAFSGPYLDITLAALVRTEDYRRYRASGNTIPPFTKVGVQGGTTGEQYIHQTLPGINIITLVDNTAAASELARYSIDAFVHDSPVVLWMVAEPHTDFSAVRLPSTRQSLGWGMRRDDPALQTAVNAQLALWKNDGFLQQTLEKWLGKDYQSLLE